jgi:hypothetical protein
LRQVAITDRRQDCHGQQLPLLLVLLLLLPLTGINLPGVRP